MRRLLLVLFLLPVLLVGEADFSYAQKAPPAKHREAESYHYVPPPAWKSVEIGDFYLRRKDYRGALSRYKEATQTDPDYAPAYRQLGRVYEKLGHKREALAMYRKYLDELPSEKQAQEAKDVHKAIRRLERELRKPGAAPSKSSR